MKRDNKPNSLQANFRIIWKGLCFVREIAPGDLPLIHISELLAFLTPYVPIYMSSKIINELSGARNLRTLIFYVAIATGVTLVLEAVGAFFERRARVKSITLVRFQEIQLNHISYQMDYAKLEDPAINAMREKVFENSWVSWGGVCKLPSLMAYIVSSVASIVVAVVLSYSMFSVSTQPLNDSSLYVFLSSIWPTAILFALVIASIVYTVVINRRAFQERIQHHSLIAKSELYNRFYKEEYLNDNKAAKDVRIFNQKNLVLHEIDRSCNAIITNFQKFREKIDIKYLGRETFAVTLLGAFIYIFVALKAIATTAFSLGSVMLYFGSINRLVSAANEIVSAFTDLRNNNEALQFFFDYVEIPSEMKMGTKLVPKKPDYRIAFHDVSFRYPGSEEYALRNVSFTLNIGERLAVVGMNGSGKTTMIKLLCRLYDPTEGSITLDGIDIKEYKYEEYLALFSVVFQDFHLLAFPLGQVVASDLEYDSDRVKQSLRMAGVMERVAEFSRGLEHPLYKHFEEDGVEVSGGEEQKIAIARALYKDAPFVILDEPTASLDPIAEYDIYSRINEIISAKTAIYISHRLSSCRFSDKIAVFHGGEMVQTGTHEQLLCDTQGKYAELWHAQAQYYN